MKDLMFHLASVQDTLHQACTYASDLAGCDPNGQKLDQAAKTGGGTYLQNLLDVFFLAAGTVALIFLIIGGIRYITSTGDSARIKAAKDTILYAIIGLIVAILAVPITGYVINVFGG